MPGTAVTMTKELRQQLPHGSDAPAAARRAVDALEGSVDADALGELRLLVSELVTNSVRHGEARAGDGVVLEIELGSDCARVEVVDGGRGFEPDPTRVPGENGGWGLLVVDRLARRWGVERADGTRVWLELDVARRDRAA
jgi:anti-sigma regulatory factor (Ser/Thr protein kinase)